MREKLVFITEEDYNKLTEELCKAEGGDNEEINADQIKAKIFTKYLGKEASMLEKVDLREQKAITAKVETSDGNVIEKVVYVSKADFEKAQKSGEKGISKLLSKDKEMKKIIKQGGQVADIGETKIAIVNTVVRTKSGKLKQQAIHISEEDKKAIESGKVELKDVMEKYAPLEKGQKVEAIIPPSSIDTDSPESPPSAIKVLTTTIQKQDGTVETKEVVLTAEEYKNYESKVENSSDELDTWLKEKMGLSSADAIGKVEQAPSLQVEEFLNRRGILAVNLF